MASRMDELESRVLALTEVTHHLQNRLSQLEAGHQEVGTRLEALGLLVKGHRTEERRLAEEQRAFAAEVRLQLKELTQAQQGLQQGVLLPLKAQMGFMEGRLDGKKETSTLLISAFLSAVGVIVSALLGLLNLQGRF